MLMSNDHPPDLAQNRIIFALPLPERDIVVPLLKSRKLRLGDILTETGEPIRTVYFPFDAAISMINTEKQSSRTVDVALIGSEGCYGCSVIQGTDKSPTMFMVDVARAGVEFATSELVQAWPRLKYLRATLE